MPGAARHTLARARALHGAWVTAGLRGHYAVARARIDECFAIARQLQDDNLLLETHSAQALLLQQQGNTESTLPHVQAMLDLARCLGRPWYESRAAEFVATRAFRMGNLSAAATELEQALRSSRGDGDWWNVAVLLGQLGDVERMRGMLLVRRPCIRRAFGCFRNLARATTRVGSITSVTWPSRRAG
jgi:hypothetical protein